MRQAIRPATYGSLGVGNLARLQRATNHSYTWHPLESRKSLIWETLLANHLTCVQVTLLRLGGKVCDKRPCLRFSIIVRLQESAHSE